MATKLDEFLPTRKSLITRLKNWDDQEGWREFFDTYGKLIYGVAVKSGFSDAEAQDLVQETVVSVARKMRGFKYDPAIGSFKNWLLLITRSRIVDCLRKKSVRVTTQGFSNDTTGTRALDQIPDPSLNHLEALWEAEWQKNLLETAIQNVKNQVTPKQYQIFDLYVMQQMPIRKITGSLGVNIGQVYLAKHRISRFIKEEVRKLEAKMK